MTHHNPSTVLVVDDDPAIIELLLHVLESADLRVLKANSGFEAVDILACEEVHVVVTDVTMDGMSGFELVDHIKQLKEPVEVIMITGHDSYEMVRRALRASAYDYLSKPLDDDQEIISAVGRACECVRLKRENKALITNLKASNSKINAANKRLTQLNTQLRKLAITDSLTQLHNRRFIDDWIQNFAFSNSNTHTQFSIMLLDIDHFKKINDTLGHDSGDKVLKHLAVVLQQANRDSDVVGRYGGEEFIVVLPGADYQQAMQSANRLRESIQGASINIGTDSVSITASVGVSTMRMSSKDENAYEMTPAEALIAGRALVSQADKALYAAKDLGRNVCVHYQNMPELHVDNVRVA